MKRKAPDDNPLRGCELFVGCDQGTNSKSGVPARATVVVRSGQDFSQISAPAHHDHHSARWSHPTIKKLTSSSRLWLSCVLFCKLTPNGPRVVFGWSHIVVFRSEFVNLFRERICCQKLRFELAPVGLQMSSNFKFRSPNQNLRHC
jgi:hypothetical protein